MSCLTAPSGTTIDSNICLRGQKLLLRALLGADLIHCLVFHLVGRLPFLNLPSAPLVSEYEAIPLRRRALAITPLSIP